VVDTSSFAAFRARMRSEPIYVILGVQGSGTNLLRSILDPVFNVSVVQDQSIVFNTAHRLGKTPSTDAVQREFNAMLPRLVPTALARKTLRRIKTNGSFEGIDAHFDASTIASGTDLAYFVYAYSAYSRNSSLMAIKSDDIWETIAHIDDVLPNRRIVLLTRDFRDNLLSITNKDFGPADPLIAARYVKERFAWYDREYKRTPAPQRIHVRYEDLLEDPDAFAARFRGHFGIGRDGEAVPPVNTGRIRSGNVKKWSRLPTSTLVKCEAILANELAEYGYARACPPGAEPNSWEWMAASLSDTVRRVPQKVRSTIRRLAR
jgi:hypothetical protein